MCRVTFVTTTMLGESNRRRPRWRKPPTALIAIGASTGGVEALRRILPAFPADCPGIVIVQHMPYGFTLSFAERLDSVCRMRVHEAKHGDRVMSGAILIAQGGN